MRVTLVDIEAAVSAYFKLEPVRLRGEGKARIVVRPRWIIYLLAREMTDLSLPYIGRRYFRDHSTVFHGVRQIRRLAEEKPQIARDIQGCREAVAVMHAARAARCEEAVRKLLEGEVPANDDQDGDQGEREAA